MNNIQNNVTNILMQEKERLSNLRLGLSEKISMLSNKAVTYETISFNGEEHQKGTFHPEMLSPSELEEYNKLSAVSNNIRAMNFVFDNWCLENSSSDIREQWTVGPAKEEDFQDMTIIANNVHHDGTNRGQIIVCGYEMEVPKVQMTFAEYKEQYLTGLQKVVESQLKGLSDSEKRSVIQDSCSEVMTPPISKGRFGR